jgi:NADH-quinone oxidoreductase subunit M
VSARAFALWAACWLGLWPAVAGAVPLAEAPRAAGTLRVAGLARPVVELAPNGASSYEGTAVIENRGQRELEVRASLRTAAREPLVPPGLSATFSPGGASVRIGPGQSRPLTVRWLLAHGGAAEIDGALLVEASGVDSLALAVRAEPPRGRADPRGLLGRHALSLLTLLPFVGMACVAIAGALDRRRDRAPRLVALGAVGLELGLVAWLLAHADGAARASRGNDGYQFCERWPVASGRAELAWALDGASYGPLAATAVVAAFGFFALRAVELRVAPAYAGLLGVLGGAMGVVTAADLGLLAASWLALVASASLLVGPAGGGRRLLAAGALGASLLVAGAVALGARAGPALLADGSVAARSLALPALGLLSDPAGERPGAPGWALAAFAGALLPAAALVPWQGWALRAIAAAPVGAAAAAAAVVPTASFYAFARLSALFPEAVAGAARGLSAAGALAALAAFALAAYETDVRRAFARLALAPLPLGLLGLAAQTPQGYAGAFALAAGQGLVVAALVLVAGALAGRAGHARRDLLVGVGAAMPRFALLAGLLAVAALASPASPTFWAALLVFFGAWAAAPLWVCVGALGLALGACLASALARTLLLGPPPRRLARDPRLEPFGGRPPDLNRRDWWLCAPLTALVVGLGCWPRPLLGPLEGAAADVGPPRPTRSPPAPGEARPFRPPPPPGKVPSP